MARLPSTPPSRTAKTHPLLPPVGYLFRLSEPSQLRSEEEKKRSMADDLKHITPLAPSRVYRRSDGGRPLGAIPRKSAEKPSKWLVYVLAVTVIASAVAMILAQIFLRVDTPKLRLQSVSVRSIRRANSSNASFNLTLVTEVSIKNPNLGYFEFGNSTGSFTYGADFLGEMKIGGGRVEARETKKLGDLQVNLRFQDMTNSSGGSESRLVDFSGHAQARGRVGVLGIVKKRKVAKMACVMKLDLLSQSIQEISCD